MVTKCNYREARDLINNIFGIEDQLICLDRDSKAKSSTIEIRINSTDGENGWPSTYKIPVDKNYKIYNCLKELYRGLANEKYQELNNLK